MKKRIIAISLLCAILASPVYADFDYSVLDSMTLEELQKLYSEVGQKIDSLKGSENDANTENTGAWVVKHYIDEFNQPTEEGYISTSDYLSGTFSNTATTNSLLYVVPLFDEDVSFKLAEYGKNVVKGYMTGGHEYNITVLSPSGEKYNMKGILRKGGDRVTLSSQYTPYFYDILNENGNVKISMKEIDRNSQYYFEIPDSSFFNNAYLQVFDNVPHHNYGTAEEIAVEYSVTVDLNKNYPTVTVLTNLPDGIKLSISLKDPFKSQTPHAVCEVVNGYCSATFDDCYLPSYMESVRIIIDTDSTQPMEMLELYGDSFDKLINQRQEFSIPLTF